MLDEVIEIFASARHKRSQWIQMGRPEKSEVFLTGAYQPGNILYSPITKNKYDGPGVAKAGSMLLELQGRSSIYSWPNRFCGKGQSHFRRPPGA